METIVVTFRIEKELLRKLDKCAEQDRRTRTGMLRIIVEDYLEQRNKK